MHFNSALNSTWEYDESKFERKERKRARDRMSLWILYIMETKHLLFDSKRNAMLYYANHRIIGLNEKICAAWRMQTATEWLRKKERKKVRKRLTERSMTTHIFFTRQIHRNKGIKNLEKCHLLAKGHGYFNLSFIGTTIKCTCFQCHKLLLICVHVWTTSQQSIKMNVYVCVCTLHKCEQENCLVQMVLTAN